MGQWANNSSSSNSFTFTKSPSRVKGSDATFGIRRSESSHGIGLAFITMYSMSNGNRSPTRILCFLFNVSKYSESTNANAPFANGVIVRI